LLEPSGFQFKSLAAEVSNLFAASFKLNTLTIAQGLQFWQTAFASDQGIKRLLKSTARGLCRY